MPCGLPAPEVEIIVAADDGTDYRRHHDDGLGPFRCVPTGVRGGGAGPARNCALAAATAPFVAFLDADDEWEPGYLAALLPLAEREGAAFGRTRVLDHHTRACRSCRCRRPETTVPYYQYVAAVCGRVRDAGGAAGLAGVRWSGPGKTVASPVPFAYHSWLPERDRSAARGEGTRAS